MVLLYKKWIKGNEFGAVLKCEHCQHKMEITGDTSKKWEDYFLPKLCCDCCQKNRAGTKNIRFFPGSQTP